MIPTLETRVTNRQRHPSVGKRKALLEGDVLRRAIACNETSVGQPDDPVEHQEDRGDDQPADHNRTQCLELDASRPSYQQA